MTKITKNIVRHPVNRNGKKWLCEYAPGFYNHCRILIDRMKPDDKWSSSGKATIWLNGNYSK